MVETLYRSVWRWHFYAGLFVMPFVLLLSVTGAIYLFKPQLDRWQESAFAAPPGTASIAADRQAEAALRAFPGARLESYRLPERRGDAALVHVGLADGGMRDVFISPDGRFVGDRDPESTIAATVARIHGSLLLGQVGDWLVELAASWAIVMIVTGLYLWWPRGRGLAGVVWPRRRAGLRDLHAVTGFWVAGLALILLVSGLPWAGVWGNAFRLVRAELGWVRAGPKGSPDWKLGAKDAGDAHAHHDHGAMTLTPRPQSLDLLPLLVAQARLEGLAHPVLVKPPGGTTREWTIKSEAQDRALARSIRFDAATGRETGRTGFADKHPLDRAVGYGISWHEGQLFGWINQLIGVLTAVALVAMAVTSFLLWRRRRPSGKLGAPLPPRARTAKGVVAIVLLACLLLPMLALSLGAVLLIEWLVLRRVPATARWLGLRAATA